jgi:hypothetical protein
MGRVAVLAVVLATSLAACGQPTPSASPTPSEMAPPSPMRASTPAERATVTPIPPTPTPSPVQSPTALPLASGPELLQDRCTACHGLDRVDHPHTRDQWESVVQLMKQYGAILTDDETQVLVDYLAETYGP